MKLLIGLCVFIAVSRCGENDLAVMPDANQELRGTERDYPAAGVDLREHTESTNDDANEYQCDPLISRPDENIDYKIRELLVPESARSKEDLIDPGKDWCKSQGYSEA